MPILLTSNNIILLHVSLLIPSSSYLADGDEACIGDCHMYKTYLSLLIELLFSPSLGRFSNTIPTIKVSTCTTYVHLHPCYNNVLQLLFHCGLKPVSFVALLIQFWCVTCIYSPVVWVPVLHDSPTVSATWTNASPLPLLLPLELILGM
jgi:hypothetical protein